MRVQRLPCERARQRHHGPARLLVCISVGVAVEAFDGGVQVTRLGGRLPVAALPLKEGGVRLAAACGGQQGGRRRRLAQSARLPAKRADKTNRLALQQTWLVLALPCHRAFAPPPPLPPKLRNTPTHPHPHRTAAPPCGPCAPTGPSGVGPWCCPGPAARSLQGAPNRRVGRLKSGKAGRTRPPERQRMWAARWYDAVDAGGSRSRAAPKAGRREQKIVAPTARRGSPEMPMACSCCPRASMP